MVFELLDYQVFAIFVLGFCFGIFVFYIYYLREKHLDMSRKEFIKRLWREFEGRGFENRVISSEDYQKDFF